MANILVLVPDAFGGRGGIALYNRDLLRAFCNSYLVEDVVALPRNLVDPIELNSLPDGLTYLTGGADSKLRFVLSTLKKAINKDDFNLIICGHVNLLPLAFAVRCFNRAPILLMLYGIEAWQPAPNRFANYLTRYVDVLVSISDITLRKFLSWSKIKPLQSFVLPNAVHLDNYAPGAKPKDLLEKYDLAGKQVLMTLGRLAANERYKGLDEVIDLLPTLLAEHANLVYLIAGEGDDRSRLEAKVSILNLKDHVVFTGFIPESRKADYYRLADAFLLPGYGEGFGFVLLEAMACGIPVLASKIDGSREALLEGKLGTLVDPRDSEELRLGILKILQAPKTVPQGLDYFSYENFERRSHSILEQIFQS
jgi:phosphatidylinositol alpha-1,6-mannosyltransferase